MVTITDPALFTELPPDLLKALLSLFSCLGEFTLRARKRKRRRLVASHQDQDQAVEDGADGAVVVYLVSEVYHWQSMVISR